MAHHFIRNKKANLDLPAKPFGMQKSSKPPSFSADMNDSALANLRKKVKVLEDDIKRRQESYVQRARVDKDQIDNLSHKLREATAGKRALIDGDVRMKVVKEMHQQILKNVENVQSTTSRILQEQERDLLRAFRARLFGVQNELESQIIGLLPQGLRPPVAQSVLFSQSLQPTSARSESQHVFLFQHDI